MRSTRDLLDHAARFVPPTTFTLSDLERRRTRGGTRRRVGSAVVALAFAAAAFGSVVVALRQPSGIVFGSSGASHALPPATEPPLVAAPGQFYHRAVLLAVEGCFSAGDGMCGSTGTRLDATYIWSPHDDSGRIIVDERYGYGIDAGTFGPGAFPNPNAIDVADFPVQTAPLTQFLLDRSAEDGTSPAPLVTPPPEGAPTDGQMWRAITDLLTDPHVTPTVRAALLDVAAGLQGSRVETDVLDPFGRSAHVIAFGNWGGEVPERLYVDPDTHELLTWTISSTVDPRSYSIFVVQDAGVVDSTETAPKPGSRSVPLTLLSVDDLGPGLVHDA